MGYYSKLRRLHKNLYNLQRIILKKPFLPPFSYSPTFHIRKNPTLNIAFPLVIQTPTRVFKARALFDGKIDGQYNYNYNKVVYRFE